MTNWPLRVKDLDSTLIGGWRRHLLKSKQVRIIYNSDVTTNVTKKVLCTAKTIIKS